MPNPFTDHRMHLLGTNSDAKWLFGCVRQECFFKRTPIISRAAMEAIARQQQVPLEAIDELVTVLSEEGESLFLEETDQRGYYCLAGDWFDRQTSTERVAKWRRRQSLELEGPGVEGVVTLNLAGLGDLGEAEKIETVANSSDFSAPDGEGSNSKIETVANSFLTSLQVTSGQSLPNGASDSPRARARTRPLARVLTSEDFDAVFEAWKTTQVDPRRVKRSEPRRKAVRDTLNRRDAVSGEFLWELEDIIDALLGSQWDDWEGRRSNNDIVDCLRPKLMEKFIRWQRDPASRPSHGGGATLSQRRGSTGRSTAVMDAAGVAEWGSDAEVIDGA